MALINRHNLALDIFETSCVDILRIADASVYSDGVVVECPTLEILMPGYAEPVVFTEDDTPDPLTINFDNRYSMVDLGLQPINSTDLICLPDGIYVIQYSVSPNELLYVKYHHLRTTSFMNKYYKELCRVQLEQCEPVREQKQRLDDLRYIKSLVDAAKAKADVCDSPAQSLDMYHYAVALLNKFINGSCITC